MNSFRTRVSRNKHLLLVSGFTFLLIYLTSFVKGYGYFIDEFYYIACALHPALGYVDHPPLSPLVLTVFQFFFGSSVYALRILPALSQAASVFLTGVIAREIGGGKFAQTLAACALGASPTVLAFGGFYSMNSFELVLATALVYYTILMVKADDPKQWIVLGILMGLGVMNKHTFGVFILALVLSLLVAGKWRLLANRWFFIGGLCGFTIFLPNILWQVFNEYPSLEFYSNISKYKNVYTPPVPFIMGQVIGMSPFTVPIWLAGTFFLLFSKSIKPFRFLSVLFVTLFLFMLLTGSSRSDRLMFAYPAAFAGGALFWEWIVVKYNARWLKGVIIALLFVGLAMALPLVLPFLGYEQVGAYTNFIGLNTEIERGKKPLLPQLLADRIGWEEKVDLVVRAYQSLPAGDQKETIIAAGNYGQAGAIELFGKNYGLPAVACGHNTYYLWSKERLRGSIVLQLGRSDDYEGLKRRFENVEPCDGEYSSKYVSFHENNLKVFVCRNPKMPFAQMLEMGKHYY
jgi:MFS family permease